ncbi:MAG TPA: uroporphyrinogen decarboxylase [Candidatus Acidoferrales bacterium]|nr:uroporphyrinogen decarboxylase [Candidatus Acidoferrales bacterium]
MPDEIYNRKQLFLRACRCEPVGRVPVWIMRQAGRYLPEYRALRENHSFLELCKTPQLAAEVSLQPFRRLGVDAIIVFSDILIVAEAMGLPLEVPDSGPVLGNPVRDPRDVERLRIFDPNSSARFVGDAIREICRSAGPSVPVLGFAAAPWTLACYMVEGQTRGELVNIKRMLYTAPSVLRALLEKIARATAPYLLAQIEAGAAAVQLFDTWAGELSREEYDSFALPATQRLIEELRVAGAPVILYSKGTAHLLESLAKAGAEVLSVDWRIALDDARRLLGPSVALQGNVDPRVLLTREDLASDAARSAISKTAGLGHILNLGHGILPDTPVEIAQAFIRAGQEYRLAAEGARAEAGRSV